MGDPSQCAASVFFVFEQFGAMLDGVCRAYLVSSSPSANCSPCGVSQSMSVSCCSAYVCATRCKLLALPYMLAESHPHIHTAEAGRLLEGHHRMILWGRVAAGYEGPAPP